MYKTVLVCTLEMARVVALRITFLGMFLRFTMWLLSDLCLRRSWMYRRAFLKI